MTMQSAPVSRSFEGSMNDRQRILIGIDFGTTYSGIGWVLTNQSQTQHIIKEWPDTASTDEKVPTVICYENEVLRTGCRWGFQIQDDELRHEWFKLGLYPEMGQSHLAARYPSMTALPSVSAAESEKFIVDYLKGLKNHTKNVINEKYAALKSTPREYIITVPAIWPERAQHTTRQLAERAGMHDVKIITEPEAAGIYAIKRMDGLDLKIGDTFVVCDAGGGTVDLISYTVGALTPLPVINEATAGSGDLCGSVFLNRVFDDWLRRKVADYAYWNDDYHGDVMGRFETDLKRNFAGDTSRSYFVPVRGLPDDGRVGIINKRLVISGREMRNIFEPVVSEVVRLVLDQMRQIKDKNMRVKAVLLAGGFGGNKYLKHRLEEAASAQGSGARVVRIENCDTAIVRGALIRGVTEREPTIATIRIDSRIARKHYGTLSYTEFRPEFHDHSNKERDALNGLDRVLCYHWFLKKDQRSLVSRPATFGYYCGRRKSDGHPGLIDIVVYACEDPERRGPPLYEDERRVKELVKLRADLTRIPEHTLGTCMGKDGLMYYKVDFDIEMTVNSASMTFALMYQGDRYDTVQQEFV